MSELSRIAHVEVRGLFGLYDHNFRLNLMERVTIIHGPNGVGKTVLLRMIASLFDGRYMEVTRVPFSAFEVSLDDGTGIRILPALRLLENTDTEVSSGLVVYLLRDLEIVDQFEFDGRSVGSPRLARQVAAEMPWLDRVAGDAWYDEITHQTISAPQVVATYGDRLPPSMRRDILKEPDWLEAFRRKVSVLLIETQRLIKLPAPEQQRAVQRVRSYVPTVESYAEALRDRIRATLAQYANQSQALDQTFPHRFLAEQTALDTPELKSQWQALEERRARLRSIGLVADNVSMPLDLDALDKLKTYERAVMSLYIDDTGSKFDLLGDIADRITLLLEIVNRKFRHKQIGVTRDEGLVAVGDNGQRLGLNGLSSGEQHELVLIYDLLFTVVPNSLVMIDEPELSLHVVWQKAFLSDLLSIVKTTDFDVLLATHSPFIVGDKTDLMVPLASDTE